MLYKFDANLTIGNNSSIGHQTFILSQKIVIGNDCLIAPFCYLLDSNHEFRKKKK